MSGHENKADRRMDLEPYFSTKEEEMIMTKSNWMPMGTVLKMNAINFPDKLGWQDKSKEFTFKQWNDRACRLADGLSRLGVQNKDCFAVLAYNRGEWMDIYAGAAKGGQIVVPLMFRLAGPDIEFIVNHSECKGLIVEEPFVDLINGIKDKLAVPKNAYIFLGEGPVPAGHTANRARMLPGTGRKETR